jgi:diguanylate cyclase (GGDEF)-like protein
MKENCPSRIKSNIFNGATLSFADIALEKAFQQDYFEKTLVQVRVTLIFAAILYGMFGILDSQVIPEIKYYTWFIRFAVISPLLLVTYFLTYTRFYRKWMRVCLFIAGIASGAGIVVMIVLAPSPGNHLYYSGVLLCALFYFVFIPDFLTASLLSWSLFVLYLLMVVFLSHITPQALMNNASAFFAFNAAGMFASYSFERYMRSDFLQRRTIQERTEELRNAMLEVEKARGKAEELSQLDPLTGAFNRRHFFSLAEKELARNARNRHRIAAIMLDIDHFKSVNDTHGHRVGDIVLQEIAGQIRNTVRTIDIPCRYGGEEFAILLPETDSTAAETIGWRLKQAIEAMRIASGEEIINITASVGVAALSEGDYVEADVLLERADQALYEAKKSGRNQVKRWNAVSTSAVRHTELCTDALPSAQDDRRHSQLEE